MEYLKAKSNKIETHSKNENFRGRVTNLVRD